MKRALRFGYFLFILFAAIVIYTWSTVTETGFLLILLELVVGSVTLAIYFLLVVVYFKTSRRTFYLTIAALSIGGYLWWLFDLG